MKYKDYRLGDVFEVKPTNKLKIKGKAYVMDGDIVCAGGTVPYISAISSNNGITGYSNYKPNNSGDCVTLSTTTDSSKTVFIKKHLLSADNKLLLLDEEMEKIWVVMLDYI